MQKVRVLCNPNTIDASVRRRITIIRAADTTTSSPFDSLRANPIPKNKKQPPCRAAVFIFGGGGGNRTRVRKPIHKSFSGRRGLSAFPHMSVNRQTDMLSSFIMHGVLKALHTHGRH